MAEPTTTTAPTAKRRQYFIDRKFQGVFMLKFFLVLLLGALLTIVITMLTTRATLTSSFDGGRLLIEKTSLAILPSVVFTSVITTLVVGLIEGMGGWKHHPPLFQSCRSSIFPFFRTVPEP